jgi:hypothetical protein
MTSEICLHPLTRPLRLLNGTFRRTKLRKFKLLELQDNRIEFGLEELA